MRFLITQEQLKEKSFLLNDPKVVSHIRKSLRLKPGDKIELFDGEGGLYKAELDIVANDFVSGYIEEYIDISKEGVEFDLVLAQALPKAGKLDDIIRMNTEAGVGGFVLFDSDYSVAKKEKYTDKKIERLNRVASEASRQSERAFIPQIIGPISFNEVIQINADVKILLHSRDTQGAVDIAQVKKQISPGSRVVALIGPEGGFSPSELKLAADYDFEICYLNLPILRTQTAGIVVSSILLY